MPTGGDVERLTSILIARYLERKGYHASLGAFLNESQLPPGINDEYNKEHVSHLELEDLEAIVSDRVQYGRDRLINQLHTLTLNNELSPLDTYKYGSPAWNLQGEYKLSKSLDLGGLPISCSFSDYKGTVYDQVDSIISSSNRNVLLCDNRLNVRENISEGQYNVSGIVRLCGTIKETELYYTSTMDGTFAIFRRDLTTLPGTPYRLHSRAITHLAFHTIDDGTFYIISCGMDNLLKVSLLNINSDSICINSVSEVPLSSMCTSLSVTVAGGDNDMDTTPLILVTRLDFTHVMCYSLDDRQRLVLLFNIALNDSEFSAYAFNVWDTTVFNFHVADEHVTSHPRTLLAAVTSHTPYMRLLIVEIPSLNEIGKTFKSAQSSPITYYDKILRNLVTQVQQSSFSRPIVRYLPAANGLIVGTDEGLYAIDTNSGNSWKMNLMEHLSEKRVRCLDVAAQDSRILVGLSDKSVYLFDLCPW